MNDNGAESFQAIVPEEIVLESGGEAEEPDAEGGPEGKNKKSGLLGGGSSPLEQLTP